ncbi:MAG: flagellar biosynthesis anti-sigma factor FlgM [Pseudomonadales bacterium]|nr:flagellar biosynthesis anti-sigma factor FlgM [Pseudomonadales bacterium]
MGLEINGLNTSQTTTNKAKGNAQVASKDGEKKTQASSGGNTTVNISDEAKSLSQLQGEVSKGDSFDEAKVAELKAAIADGSYKPDANKIAGKLLDIDGQF